MKYEVYFENWAGMDEEPCEVFATEEEVTAFAMAEYNNCDETADETYYVKVNGEYIRFTEYLPDWF